MDSACAGPTIMGYPDVLPRPGAEQLQAFRTISELREGPIPAVLDTSCVRNGLEYQLVNGRIPASMAAVRSGRCRIFMELDTLHETWNRLPKFAGQLDVSLGELQRMFADEWLPLLSVVSLPDVLREIDPRAAAVRDLDPDDYPTAALATLLSPCILLTRNHRHFSPLGVKVPTQGVDAVFAAIEVKAGEIQVQAIMLVPAAPALAIGGTAKWAAEKIGPIAWVVLALLVAGGVVLYQRQPPERKKRIKRFASETGKHVLDEYTRASNALQQAQDQLGAYVIPGPEERSVTSAVFRKLAMADESLSAQQLCERLDYRVAPVVDPLRRFLHGNKTTVFREVRRGGFVLGGKYSVRQPIQA